MKPLSDRTRLIASATKRGAGRRPVNPPIERASTMLSDQPERMRDPALGPVYGLEGGSAARALCDALADLEGAQQVHLTPSGLSAVTVPLLALLKPGDEVVTSDGLYGPSRRFLTRHMAARGVSTRFHPAVADSAAVAGLISERTRLVLIESPASLTFEMLDVRALTGVCRARGVLSVMDNTWAAGLAFKPLTQGVDVSVQALTKYVAGHSDMLMGSVATCDPKLGRAITETVEDLGWHVSPDDAWLALRGLRTLPVRYAEQGRSALEVARWLAARPEVARVLHPALPDAAGHDLWRRDYGGSAGLLGVVMNGGDAASAHALMTALTLFGLGYSWGGFESLITHETGQLALRADPPKLEGALLRLHIGLEDPNDLIADLEIGLAAWASR
ncbi:cystathionine beta-lyase [Brevundimonas sp. S30B]|uniref:cystathionine beta-lyase n=1 Tax=unclassified Brevundimonas TaxID=2622653 RepID=UPI001072374A|nr:MULTISPECIES: cystathionine beta-lyase [unclassified Brevundimonas]QBX37991.1 cystathionine beta-lyase [Brevundimonas sp. MF30-B]TFW02654.1 cystathionine beta-lyase [Brevundimonas sp. S30B]